MKKQILALMVMGSMLPGAASAAGFLNNWKMDIDQDGLMVNVAEYVDLIGNSYIVNTDTGGGTFSFVDDGFFSVAAVDGGGFFSLKDGNDGAAPSAELTAIFTNGVGVGTYGGDFIFTGGDLDLYADFANNYGDAPADNDGIYYGANDGTHIGNLSLVDGWGTVDAAGVPNGEITLIFEAVSLASGYFFDEFNNDLSTMLSNPEPILFGFVTTNASAVDNPTAAVSQELGEISGTGAPVFNNPPGTILVSNNGQYRWTVPIPEPTVMALMGVALFGMGFAGKRRKV